MPVHVKKIGDKYRIVGPSGKIEKTSGGKSRDGGGHRSKSEATKQVRAMNRKYYK